MLPDPLAAQLPRSWGKLTMALSSVCKARTARRRGFECSMYKADLWWSSPLCQWRSQNGRRLSASRGFRCLSYPSVSGAAFQCSCNQNSDCTFSLIHNSLIPYNKMNKKCRVKFLHNCFRFRENRLRKCMHALEAPARAHAPRLRIRFSRKQNLLQEKVTLHFLSILSRRIASVHFYYSLPNILGAPSHEALKFVFPF